MDKNFLNKLSFSLIAQVLSIVVSLIFSLGITKVLDVAHYGYWQLFILYSNYAGFFHLGICDGLYLKHGGRSMERVNTFNFTNQLSLFLLIEIFISILFAGTLVFTTADPIKLSLLFFIVPYLIIANLQTYLSYILLATNKIEAYSISVFIEKIFIIVSIIILYIFKEINVNALIYIYIIGKLLSIFYLVYFVYPIIELKALFVFKFKTIQVLSKYALIGIPLMFSNVLSTLIIGSNRLLTEHKYGIIAFSKLSFSISLVFLFIIFVSQIGIVLFPLLRRMNEENRKQIYYWIDNNLTILFASFIIFYYPLVVFVQHYVPNYFDSVKYLSLMLPICIFEGKFQILFNTMYKVLNRQKTIFIINFTSLLVSLLLTYLSLYLFDSIILSIYSLVLIIVLRSVFSEMVLNKILKIGRFNLIVESVFIAFAFIVINIKLNLIYGFICYSVLLCTYIIFKYLRNEISRKFNPIT
ncbi:hypothetical protein LZQ00_17030 [Sphingobacterium sp. SRCM116780]|uniref:hypothetical protein n=1 Tax=Sphingobacterium sp. SRCM116780 TaxID=2907623 RepID=UPI001F46B0A9|nr:hypothetical protein [Sphingobacterium sp. SRCM116780]UIR55953.1 hypothetical protein LZQ00_17030 [Sphingobacterium sp. SRCM116780]